MLREQIASKQLSPVELMQAVLARAEKLQPVLNCFITLVPEQAMAAARQAEDAVMQGKPLGLLHGIPFAAKDLVNTAGVRTTFGSLLHDDNVPKRGRRRRGAREGGRRDPVRQDHDAGVRPQGVDRRAAVRPHAQCLERRAHLGRLERRRGGRGGGRHRADRHRHRRRRLDPHSRGVPTAWSASSRATA